MVQLGSQEAAARELSKQLADYATEAARMPGHTYDPFPVETIPGAHGFRSANPSGGEGVNVLFADGKFVYHVGAGWSRGASSPPTAEDVVSAAERLYRRVSKR